MMATRYEELRKLSKVFTLRMKFFVAILLVSVVVTILQPSGLISWFKQSYAEMLTRLWLATALVTTIVITFIANRQIVTEGARGSLTTEEWGKRIATASNLNMLILAYALLVILLASLPGMPLLLINLLGGIFLVALVMRFDWEVLTIRELVVKEATSKVATAAASSADQEARRTELTAAEAEFKLASDVFLKLDIPICCGIAVTFIVGQLILPFVIAGVSGPAGAEPYACGFASGATALQLLVGNVTFETMQALRS